MKPPLQAAIIAFALAVLSLAACGNDGPSEADMMAALKSHHVFSRNNMIYSRVAVVSVTKKECHAMKAPDPTITKSYYCHFDATFNPPIPADSTPFSGLFYVDPREETWQYTYE